MNQNRNQNSTINNTRVQDWPSKKLLYIGNSIKIKRREIKEMAQIERNAAFSRHKTSQMFTI